MGRYALLGKQPTYCQTPCELSYLSEPRQPEPNMIHHCWYLTYCQQTCCHYSLYSFSIEVQNTICVCCLFQFVINKQHQTWAFLRFFKLMVIYIGLCHAFWGVDGQNVLTLEDGHSMCVRVNMHHIHRCFYFVLFYYVVNCDPLGGRRHSLRDARIFIWNQKALITL